MLKSLARNTASGLLQIIALLASNPHLFALNSGLHLELAVFDVSHDFFRQLFIDTLAQRGFLLHAFAGWESIFIFQTLHVDFALNQ